MKGLNNDGSLSTHTTVSCDIKFLSIFRIFSLKMFTFSFKFCSESFANYNEKRHVL